MCPSFIQLMIMKTSFVRESLIAVALVYCLAVLGAYNTNEKEPPLINPGPPPSDAIILFDGKDLSTWQSEKVGEAGWKLLGDGSMEVNGTGSIMTKEELCDC